MSRDDGSTPPGPGAGWDADLPPEPLAALLHRARAGDRTALEAFASALYPVVRAALGRRVRRGVLVDPDDLTQVAVARAVARLDRCDAADDRGVRAWVSAVAWRVALEELRTGAAALARHSLSLDENDHDPTAGRDFGLDDMAAREGDASRESLARAAVEALDRMPRQVGLLFWMRLVEDASWSEVAAAFDTSTAGVKRRFQRAVAALRRALTGGRDG